MKSRHSRNDVLEMITYAVYDIWCMKRRTEQPEVQNAIDEIGHYFQTDKCGKDFIESKVLSAVCTQEEYAFKNSLKFWLGVVTIKRNRKRQWKNMYWKVRRKIK